MKLILIRHGMTEYNKRRKYCGQTDVWLSRAGRADASRVGEKLRGMKIGRIFSSDLRRARQTARIAFGRAAEARPSLKEIDFGLWEGLTYEEVMAKYASIYKRWLANPFSVKIPSGEKMAKFSSRVKNEFNRIVKEAGDRHDTVAVVSHVGPMRVFLNDLAGIKRKDFWSLEIEPGAIFIIGYSRRSKPKAHKL